MATLYAVQRKFEPFLAFAATVSAHASSPTTAIQAASTASRSTRMFLLKNLDRVRGTSFLRSVLMHPLFADTTWLKVCVACSSFRSCFPLFALFSRINARWRVHCSI
jgi:hypothetical protein